MSFQSLGLDPRLLKNVETQGYTVTTPIQKKAIPAILEGRDVVGLAQTGTGKTAAFVLPLLHRLMTGPRHQLRALIVGPRGALRSITEARQMLNRCAHLRRYRVCPRRWCGYPRASHRLRSRSG